MKEITLTLRVANEQESLVRNELIEVVTRLGADWSIGSSNVDNFYARLEAYILRMDPRAFAASAPKFSEETLRKFLEANQDVIEVQDPPSVVSPEAFFRLLEEVENPIERRPISADLDAMATHAKLITEPAAKK